MRLIYAALLSTLFAGLHGEEMSNEIAMQPRECDPCELLKSVKKSTPERVNCLEEEMQDIYLQCVRGDFGAKAASANPQIDSDRLFIKSDLLYWTMYEGGTDFVSTDTAGGVADFTGSVESFDFNWHLGFRVAAGYRFPHDAWNFTTEYTWFRDKASKTVSVPSVEVFPLIVPGVDSTFLSASGSWRLNYSNIDFRFSKSYFVHHALSVTPAFALKTAWINQRIKGTYSDATTPFNATSNTKNNFWGIGPLGSLSLGWHIGSHFNFFSAFAGSLMIGGFKVQTKFQNTTSSVTLLDLTQNVTQVVPYLHGALGVQWETRFNRDRNNFSFQLAYESEYWWRQNQTYSYGFRSTTQLIKRTNEDLSLHGLTFNAQFDF